MEGRQDLLEIRRLFNKMFEEVVWDFLKRYPYLGDPDINSLDREISFSISKGDMYFCKGKYYLVGDGEGSNPVLDQIYERNTMQNAPTFSMKIPYSSKGIYLLHLDRADTVSKDTSYFVKDLRTTTTKPEVHSGEQMFESEDFKNCILQMVKDIKPDWLYKFESLLA